MWSLPLQVEDIPDHVQWLQVRCRQPPHVPIRGGEAGMAQSSMWVSRVSGVVAWMMAFMIFRGVDTPGFEPWRGYQDFSLSNSALASSVEAAETTMTCPPVRYAINVQDFLQFQAFTAAKCPTWGPYSAHLCSHACPFQRQAESKLTGAWQAEQCQPIPLNASCCDFSWCMRAVAAAVVACSAPAATIATRCCLLCLTLARHRPHTRPTGSSRWSIAWCAPV